MKKFLNWFTYIIIVSLLFLLLALGSAVEKNASYKTATPKNFIQFYETQALKETIGILQKVNLVAQIKEALNCPCYDIEISTQTEGATIIRIDKGRCSDADNNNQDRQGQNKSR